MVEVDLRLEIRVIVRVRFEGIPVVGAGGGWWRVFGGDGRGSVRGGGALDPWLGGGGRKRVILGLPPGLFFSAYAAIIR